MNEEIKDGEEGGESNIMPPCTRREDAGEGERETGGEDTLVMSLDVAWRLWDVLRAELEKGREAALEKGGVVPVKLNGLEFLVHPSGSGHGFTYARYFVESEGLSFSIQDKPSGTPERHNVRITAGSIVCMYWKAEGLYKHAETVLATMGGLIRGTLLSRVDMCVDLPGADIREFHKAHATDCMVSRARHEAVYYQGRKVTGIQIGKGEIVVRIYEKAVETGREGIKWDYLCRMRYRGVPERAVRVEIQLRRETLKELGVDSFEDYKEKKSAIVEYVLNQWVRMCDKPVDRDNRHQDLGELHPLWVQVLEAFKAWTGAASLVLKRVQKSISDVEKLLKQALGCLASAELIDTGAVPCSPRDLLSDMFVAMHSLMKKLGPEYFLSIGERCMLRRIKKVGEYRGDDEPAFRWLRQDVQYDFDWGTGQPGVINV